MFLSPGWQSCKVGLFQGKEPFPRAKERKKNSVTAGPEFLSILWSVSCLQLLSSHSHGVKSAKGRMGGRTAHHLTLNKENLNPVSSHGLELRHLCESLFMYHYMSKPSHVSLLWSFLYHILHADPHYGFLYKFKKPTRDANINVCPYKITHLPFLCPITTGIGSSRALAPKTQKEADTETDWNLPTSKRDTLMSLHLMPWIPSQLRFWNDIGRKFWGNKNSRMITEWSHFLWRFPFGGGSTCLWDNGFR